jgi:NAD(P)-dependent dehydrogenase (short-subunit alcohol dehydrogenase family)
MRTEVDGDHEAFLLTALDRLASALPTMMAQGSGSIVSISSIAGLRGAPRRSIYAATKAALDGMTHALAMEYGPRGIRANAVAPGVVDTEMWGRIWPSPAWRMAVLGLIPTRRLSTAEEVISADGGIHSTVNLWPTA